MAREREWGIEGGDELGRSVEGGLGGGGRGGEAG